MELIELYIFNFGKLSSFSYKFNDNLNQIIEPNGYGKTTISAFIDAMLYGVTETNKRLLDDNTRKKYSPWNKGIFGGTLTIQVNNKVYKIERTFGKKSSDDTFKLYDESTKKESNDYSSNIGEEILKLNEDSFQRSTFIPQKELEIGFNDAISSSLSNLVNGTNDIQNYESSIKILKNRMSELKKTGNKGLLNDKSNEINEIEKKINIINQKLNGANVILDTQKEDKDKLDSLEKEKEEINRKINIIRKNSLAIENKNIIQNYSKQIDGKNNEKAILLEKLNNNQIDLEELEKARHEENEINLNISKLNDVKLKIDNYTKQNDQIELFFNNNVPSEDDLSGMLNKCKRIDELTPKEIDYSKSNSHLKEYILLIVGVLAMITGIILIKNTLITSIILLISGGISFLVGLFMLLLYKNNSRLTNDEINEKINLTAEIKSYFSSLGIQDTNYKNVISELLKKSMQYNYNKNLIENFQNDERKINDLIFSYKESLDCFFSKYNLDSSNYKDKINELEKIQQKINNINQYIDIYTNIIHDKEKKVVTTEDISCFPTLEQLNFNLNSIENNIKDLNEKIIKADKDIQSLTESQSELDEYTSKLDKLKEDKNKMLKEYSSLENACKYLNLSNEELSKKYLAPMKNQIDYYLEKIYHNKISLSIDINFKVSLLDENKILRDINYLSEGNKKIISLIMRLSLAHCLYPNEKLFMILDDPFVDLDEENLKNCQQAIKEISKSYQIIYFTCHEIRKID